MEGIFLVLILVAGAIFLLPVIAIAKASSATRRAEKLEQRLLSLEFDHGRLNETLTRTRLQLENLTRETQRSRAPVPAQGFTPPPAVAAPEPAASELTAEVATDPAASAVVTPAAPESAAAAVSDPAAAAAPESAAAAASDPAAAAAAAPESAAAAAPPASDSTPTPAPPFDWERWIGVRGAAVLGGIVLALAGVLFFRYAIDHALLSPSLRVVFGTLLGLTCLVVSAPLRKRYGITAHALAGGGMVVLYATFWAARALYGLIGMELAFALMTLTTAVGCLLAVRSSSLLIAILGLVGGFLTPLLLSSGQDRPIGLFGYVLLLDAGFILAARKRGWTVVLGLALAGTLLLEGAWIVGRMGSERAGLGLCIVAVFVCVFVLAGVKPPAAQRSSWFLGQAASLLLPFGFAVYFASLADLGAHLWPITLLLGLLSLGAGFVARNNDAAKWLPPASAVGATTVVAVWLSSASFTAGLAWEAALCALGLAGVFQLLVELAPSPSELGASARAAIVAELGLFACLIVAASGGPIAELPPWLSGFVGLALLLLVHARLPRRAALSAVAAGLLALGFITFQRGHAGAEELPALSTYFAIEVALALGFQVFALARPQLEHHLAAALFPGSIALGVLAQKTPLPASSPAEVLGPLLALGALSLFAGTRARDARWLPPAALVLVIAQDAALSGLSLDANSARIAFGIQFASALFCTLWPALVKMRLQEPLWALYVSALAGPAWFLSLRALYVTAFGDAAIGVLPVVLGAISLAMLAHFVRRGVLSNELRRSTLAWYAAVALGFASVAIPLQLEKQWITIGWALESAAVLVLFRRLNHAGLKWFGLALALAVSVRLLVNPAVLDYELRGGRPILNWLLYTYWVPALSLLGGYFVLKHIELARVRPWERGLYASGHSLGALGLVVAVIAIVFAWLNLAIVDAFSEGSRLVLDLERRPARDLTISLSWVGYAGALLALGMAKNSRGLRWLSLVFMVLSIGKVFLYDLGTLRDLYRVLSLLGLAFSLICVSLAYQRFVFGQKSPPRSP
jgi:uncharacterized membrane protein